MAHCPLIESCTFLQDEMFCQMRGLIQRFQQSYCHDNYSGCARYKVASALGESYVPSPMIPTQIDWAEQILKEDAPSSQVDSQGE